MAISGFNSMATTQQKLFLKELEALEASLRQEIEAKQQGLDPSPEAISLRRKKVLSGDFKFFAYNYFPHHIWGTPSVFQREFCASFPKLIFSAEGSSDWWIAPRGEAKSTLLTKIGPVFIAVIALLQDENIRKELGLKLPPIFIDIGILFGAEAKFPIKLLTVLKVELEVNPALKLDFPEVMGKTAIWKMEEVRTKSGVTFEPRGAEQATRGAFVTGGASRPKIFLGDDLITDKEARSPTVCKSRWEWLEGTVDYLGPPDDSAKLMVAGTAVSNNDPVAMARRSIGHDVHHYKALIQYPNNMDMWENCEELMRNADAKFKLKKDKPSFKYYLKNKKQMEVGAVVSWASVRSLYDLMFKRAKSRTSFEKEMQNNPRNEEDKVFSDVHFWVNKLSQWMPYGACDPSMGKSAKADPSSIIVGLWDKENQKLHIDHCETKRRVMSKLEADLISAQQEYRCIKWGFENNNAYEAMRIAIIDSAMRKGVAMPMLGITNTIGQDLLIDSIEPFVNGSEAKIFFNSKLVGLLDELDTYPEKQQNHHYDGLVGLGLLWQIVGNSRLATMPIIQSAGIKHNLFTRY